MRPRGPELSRLVAAVERVSMRGECVDHLEPPKAKERLGHPGVFETKPRQILLELGPGRAERGEIEVEEEIQIARKAGIMLSRERAR